MKLKQNKQKIYSHIRPNVKQDLLDGYTIKNVADKYGLTYNAVFKYYNGAAFTFREKDGIKYRRCSNCMFYRTYDNFHGIKNKQSFCKDCRNQLCRNDYIVNKVKHGDEFKNKTNERFMKQYRKGIINIRKCLRLRVRHILENNFRIKTK